MADIGLVAGKAKEQARQQALRAYQHGKMPEGQDYSAYKSQSATPHRKQPVE